MITKRGALTVAAAGVFLAGCSTVQTPSKQDPLEGFNRTVFKFNDKVDQVAIRPVAKAYNNVLPQPVRSSVSNFFSNIGDVSTAANSFLQGNMVAGTESIMRVVINTVFGLGGLFDVATQARLPKHEADFGLTLGHYGVPPGPYLVLPLLGPSTVRDASGFIVDRFVDPASYVKPNYAAYALYGLQAISLRASLLNATDLLADAALDKYSFVRNAYLQRRQYLLGKSDSSLPDYGDSGDADEGATPAAKASGASAASGVSSTPSGSTGTPSTLPPGGYFPKARLH